MLDNSILESGLKSRDPEYFRVSTPPRVITLSEHHFPSASDEPERDDYEVRYSEPKTLEFADDVKKNNRNNRKVKQNSQEMVINHRWVFQLQESQDNVDGFNFILGKDRQHSAVELAQSRTCRALMTKPCTYESRWRS